jgi:hypothetical protein
MMIAAAAALAMAGCVGGPSKTDPLSRKELMLTSGFYPLRKHGFAPVPANRRAESSFPREIRTRRPISNNK